MLGTCEWYVMEGNVEQGPFSLSDLNTMVRDGCIGPAALVRCSDMSGWVPASTVKGLLSAADEACSTGVQTSGPGVSGQDWVIGHSRVIAVVGAVCVLVVVGIMLLVFRSPPHEGLRPTHEVNDASAPQCPDWAAAGGCDHYGHWADLRVGEALQRMRWIRAGSYQRGSPADELGRRDNERQHYVHLTRGFWMADSPCTQSLWQAVMGNNPSHFTGDDKRPVEQVSWTEVQQFLQRLNAQFPGLQARLPTEAEWEYAARAGTTGDRYGELDAIAWHRGNSGRSPHPVRQKQANTWGLYDMIGNVWEWCSDRYGAYPAGPVTDPAGPAPGSRRVYRGGGWSDGEVFCRAAYRGRSEPGFRLGNLGFRFVAPGQ